MSPYPYLKSYLQLMMSEGESVFFKGVIPSQINHAPEDDLIHYMGNTNWTW